jgi:hypothetical protein
MLVGSLVMAFFISLNMEAMTVIQDALGGSGTMDAVSLILIRRFFDPFASLAPFGLIAAAAAVLLGRLRRKPAVSAEGADDQHLPADPLRVDAFVLILVLWGAFLILFPEYFYLRDFFGNRINTVFKFYFQGWTFLSLAAAYGIFRLVQKVLDRSDQDG